MNGLLAQAVLAIHLGVIAFNLFGLVAIPLGGWLGWRFVRGFWWRAAHLACLAVVALQAALGQACFLTLWQDALSGGASGRTPMIMAAINRAIYWPLPIWVFAVMYLAVFAYALALWWWVPPDPPRRPA